MARALFALALACAVASPLAFSVYGTPRPGMARSSTISFRGSVAAADAPAGEATSSSWMPMFLMSAAVGLMVSLASPQAATAAFTTPPAKTPDKVSAKVPTKKDRISADKAKVEKAKKNKLAVYTDNSEAAFVRA
mmetsp:Transcript_65742/g.122584  ORF Transcript_65742/g.122584 Transcript_65742/m.122584 type:complete len:135 (+) Transcript_65742:69-473(+)